MHRRGVWAAEPVPAAASVEVFFFGFLAGGLASEQTCSGGALVKINQGLVGDEEEEDEVELEDDSAKDGDPSDQTRPPVRVLLLLALAGTGV